MFRFALLGWAASLATCPQASAGSVVFKHVVIIIQENRTIDNLFGSDPNFEPGVDIATSGKNSKGTTIPLSAIPLAGCYDIDHSHRAFESALTKGFDQETVIAHKCPAPNNPQFKFVDNSDGTVQPYFDLAQQYGFANRMFQTNQGPSFAAHQFLFSGTSAPVADSPIFASEIPLPLTAPTGCIAPSGEVVKVIDGNGSEKSNKAIYPCFEHPALSDLLDAASPPLDWRYYAPMAGSIWTAPDAIQHICMAKNIGGQLQCTGKDWTTHVVPDHPERVLSDIANCALPAVSWVNPKGALSDHAVFNNGKGPQWVASIVNAIGSQSCKGESYWQDTAIFVTWDDWGGWYDHVPPFNIVRGINWGAGYTYGFRVPLLVVSAYTPTSYVNNDILDFGSILYFVEQNFGLGFIGSGTDTYTKYADFQAAAGTRGSLSSFFTLSSPKAFTPIITRMSGQDFINAPKSIDPPDDD